MGLNNSDYRDCKVCGYFLEPVLDVQSTGEAQKIYVCTACGYEEED